MKKCTSKAVVVRNTLVFDAKRLRIKNAFALVNSDIRGIMDQTRQILIHNSILTKI